MSHKLLDFLDAWDLMESDAALATLSLQNWDAIAEGLESLYTASVEPVAGSVCPGLHLGNRIIGGDEPTERIVPHLLTAPCVWLPDPVFSFVTKCADSAWRAVPDSGSKTFGNEIGPTFPYRTLWSVNRSQRGPLAKEKLPKILQRIRELAPLIRTGAIRLHPWEPAFLEEKAEIAQAVNATGRSKDIQAVTKLYSQGEYTLGIRVGAVNFIASENQPPDSTLRPGDGFHFVDKVPSLVYSFINTAYTVRTGGLLAPERRGDRALFDYILSGVVQAPRRDLAPAIHLPALSRALLPEVAAIRANSEALAVIRGEIAAMAKAESLVRITEIENRIVEAAEKIRSDSSLWNLAKQEVTLLYLSAVSTAGATVATGGTLGDAVTNAAIGSLPAVWSIRQTLRSEKSRQGRSAFEILSRVAGRLDEQPNRPTYQPLQINVRDASE